MGKLVLRLGNCYRATQPDGTEIVFKFLGTDNNSQLLIEVNNQHRLFNEMIPGWISIEEIRC
ncbi:MAG: hypothetical protein ACK40G_18550 [Cytophagaceae bacterium]